MDDSPRTVLDDEEGEHRPEDDVVRLQEVAGPDLAGVVVQERRPALTPRPRTSSRATVLLDRSLADVNAELEQLAPDALCTPGRLSTAMRLMRSIVLEAVRGLVHFVRESIRQRTRNPARCPRRIVSGLTSSTVLNPPGFPGAKADECSHWNDWQNKTNATMQATVPPAERQAAKTPEEFAAWHRKLAKAYKDESKMPPVFKHADIKPLEERMRAYWGKSGDLLERIADAFGKDRAKMEKLQVEQGKASLEQGVIVKDWAKVCSPK
jgi:hypothetical protein